ncbi:hypothetical protein F5148DRAFT_1211024 [Russula earlei]|uniref:Uncharacterized protein n=1 Tax=Russula earlei TaxID=71964 RepID=A0ACC0U5S9_9AGAM|nr:hypothetical protein F5148DRAFT_1211024 [Russula earlei]
MRTSGSVLVLALFCLAVGIAPLFAHASAIHFDKRGGFLGFGKGNSDTEKLDAITRQLEERIQMLKSAKEEAQTVGSDAAAASLEKKYEKHQKFLNKMEAKAKRIYYKNSNPHSRDVLVSVRMAKADTRFREEWRAANSPSDHFRCCAECSSDIGV